MTSAPPTSTSGSSTRPRSPPCSRPGPARTRRPSSSIWCSPRPRATRSSPRSCSATSATTAGSSTTTGTWRSGFEIGETEVPQGVRLVLGRRLDQLDADHRKLLATAAVIGRTFSFGHLAGLVDRRRGRPVRRARGGRAAAPRRGGAGRARRPLRLRPRADPPDPARANSPRPAASGSTSGSPTPSSRAPATAPRSSSPTTSSRPGRPPRRSGPFAALLAAAEASLGALAFEDALRHLDNAEPLVDDAGSACAAIAAGDSAPRARAGSTTPSRCSTVSSVRRPGADEEIALRLQRVQLLNDQYRAAEGLDDIAALVGRGRGPRRSGSAHRRAAGPGPGPLHPVPRPARPRPRVPRRLRGRLRGRRLRAATSARWPSPCCPPPGSPTTGPTTARPPRPTSTRPCRLAEEIGDDDLVLDGLAAGDAPQRPRGQRRAESEALLARLEARRDPVKLNAHCFWMMWQYFALGRFADAVAMCDRGIELAELIGSQPVQYGGIKAIALSEMGRFDEVAGAIDQEVTDDDHPFGQAMASLARSVYLTRLAAWRPAADSLADTLARATELSRVWMQGWAAIAPRHRRRPPPGRARRRRRRDGLGGVECSVADLHGRWPGRGGPGRGAGRRRRRAWPAHGHRRTGADDSNRDAVMALDVLARAHLAARRSRRAPWTAATRGPGAGSGDGVRRHRLAAPRRSRRWRSAAVGRQRRRRPPKRRAARPGVRDPGRSASPSPSCGRWFERQPLAPV